MNYFSNLWNAIIGRSNKKKKIIIAKKQINKTISKIENIQKDYTIFDKLYTFSEVAIILSVTNERLSNILSQHKKTFGVYLLDNNASGKRKNAPIISISDIDKIKNSHYYKLTKEKQRKNNEQFKK